MQEVTRYLTIEYGVQIAYRRAGSGPPLMLLHGFICDGRAWRPQLEDLSRDFDVIAWDAPGCGGSTDPPEDFTMEQFARRLAQFMDLAGIASAHMLGLSWGGTLLMKFHEAYPSRIRSLVLADTYAGWTGSLGEHQAQQRLARCLRDSLLPPEAWIPQWVPEAFSNAAPKKLLDDYASIMWDFHPAGFRAMSRAVTPDFTGMLSKIAVPTLLIWGNADTRSPVTCARAMRDTIKNARLVLLPGGHLVNIEAPERFNAEVRDFIRAVEAK